MSRILLHTLVFAPDGVSTSTLLSELMQDLQAQGHRITVLTTRPHYNRDLEAEAKQPLRPFLGGLYSISDHYGMRVIHTWMPRKGQGVSGRLRDYLIFHILSLILGTLMIGRQDVVIAPSPPLSIGMIGWLLAILKGGKFIYNVRELYPALAVQMGLASADSMVYRLMAWLERFVYARSKVVVVICEMFRQHVVKLGFASEKVLNIPDFVDTDFIRPMPKDNPLTRQYNLFDKFVVQYAGNIGMTQSFDTIMEVAGRLQDEPDIHFLIVGDGARRQYVQEQIANLSLKNITLLPYQPRSEVPFIYAAADISLVPLMAGTAQTTIPSKIYTIMASGRPALVSVDVDSELVWIVEQANCGIAVPPDDADTMEAGIRRVFAEQEFFKACGINGRHYVEKHFSRRAVSEQFNNLITHITTTS
ncbi:MAG: glycosyltransferase family 4 protein [Burkholderiales bacterium]|nr:glycosyltransferase family 4 protein [Anaerolineae bacterium]